MNAKIEFDGCYYGVTIRNTRGAKLWTRAFETELQAILYCIAGHFDVIHFAE